MITTCLDGNLILMTMSCSQSSQLPHVADLEWVSVKLFKTRDQRSHAVPQWYAFAHSAWSAKNIGKPALVQQQ